VVSSNSRPYLAGSYRLFAGFPGATSIARCFHRSHSGIVLDPTGARIASATVLVINQATGLRRGLMTNDEGGFAAQLLPPGVYGVRVTATGMSPLEARDYVVELGSIVELRLSMRVAGAPETVTITDNPGQIASLSPERAEIIDRKSIQDLPLNGRRFADLALLSPTIVQDPRGLTSDSNGDLASGGIRGYQTQSRFLFRRMGPAHLRGAYRRALRG